VQRYILLIAILLTGCAEIQHKTKVSQSYGEVKAAGIGDVVYKSTSEKSLPNIFGNASIFGRTTPTGTTTITYQGIQDGKAYFVRRSIDIETGATTMNSTPIVIPNSSTTTYSGSIGRTPYSGVSTTQGAPIILPPNTPQAQYMERSPNTIIVDLRALPATFVAEGTTVKILTADGGTLKYMLEK
jgi:hypothetical protein